MTIRKLAGRLHRWVGLAVGAVVFVVAVTGCLYAFERELLDVLHREVRRVEPPAAGAAPRSVTELLETARAASPEGRPIGWIEIHRDPRRSVQFDTWKENPDGRTYFSTLAYYDQVYVDPYRGTVLGVVDKRLEPLYLVRMTHQTLLLGETGSTIVGTATILFLGMVLTGLVLWVPRNRSGWKARFRVAWKAGPKRRNYDLHNVPGFYLSGVLLVLAVTGPVWSFGWWTDGIYRLLGASDRPSFESTVRPPPAPAAERPLDVAVAKARELTPEWKELWVSLPESPGDPIGVSAYLGPGAEGTGWDAWDDWWFSPHDGSLVDGKPFAEKTLAMRWRNSNYGIHTGQIYGLPTQVLAFLGSLVAAALPVTGFLIWRRRGRKPERRPAPPRATAADAGARREPVGAEKPAVR